MQGGRAPGSAAASLPTGAAAAVRPSVRLSAGCGSGRLAALAGPEPLTPPSSRPWEEASHGAGLARGGFLPPLTPRGPAGCGERGAGVPGRRVLLPLRPSCLAYGPVPHTARRGLGPPLSSGRCTLAAREQDRDGNEGKSVSFWGLEGLWQSLSRCSAPWGVPAVLRQCTVPAGSGKHPESWVPFWVQSNLEYYVQVQCPSTRRM